MEFWKGVEGGRVSLSPLIASSLGVLLFPRKKG